MTWVFWYVGMVIVIAGIPAGVLANLLFKPATEDQ